MPVMDGWEATRQLEADGRTSHIPVVAFTGLPLPFAAAAVTVGLATLVSARGANMPG